MKTKIFLIIIVTALIGARPVQADTEWYSGHYEIVDGDTYGEIRIYNDVTLDIFGGDIGRLETYDTTVTDWYGGGMSYLWTRDDSSVNIYGGELHILWAAGDSLITIRDGDIEGVTAEGSTLIDLYAYDVFYHTTGGYWDGGWVEGKYLDSDIYFSFDIENANTFSHINIVPEPATLLLLGLGWLLLRKRK